MKKKGYRMIVAILAVLIIFSGVFFAYVQNYYHIDSKASETLLSANIKEVGNNLIIVSPENNSQKGFIFYPGGKVDEKAYLPFLEKLSRNGVTCILVKMPFHLAVFNKDAADNIYDKFPEIKQWYIGGHSLGGAMASSYASENKDKFSGLILLGSYHISDYPLDRTVTIYGSNDQVLNKSKINYTENIFVIEGGNHAQFGNYGKQKGDGVSTISDDEQQDETVKIIVDLLK